MYYFTSSLHALKYGKTLRTWQQWQVTQKLDSKLLILILR